MKVIQVFAIVRDFAEMGLKCNVGAVLDIDPKDHIDRKILRFMGPSASYAYMATERAIADAGLTEDMVSNLRTGLVMGSGGVSGEMFTETIDVMRSRGIKRAGSLQGHSDYGKYCQPVWQRPSK